MVNTAQNNISTFHILLGSNLGNKEANIENAIQYIVDEVGVLVKQSPLHFSKAWGFESTEEFVNAVIEVRSAKTPEEVLSTLLTIESKMGRYRDPESNTYIDRLIDLDILLHGDNIVDSPTLTIPHPKMHLRAFTLIPLLNILPEGVHPKCGVSFKKYLAELS